MNPMTQDSEKLFHSLFIQKLGETVFAQNELLDH